ncbi:hypothetical protein [Gracilibacillus xinjiangensis]|uniref:Uncharacterized protein n=1 Tax=Gracilibacillus xinjiangensis TaxID=1193282 RepID=A0ABV8WTH5_9BACI
MNHKQTISDNSAVTKLTMEDTHIIYSYLQQQYDVVCTQTKEAVQNNDYITLLQLIEERQRLEAIMDDFRTFHANTETTTGVEQQNDQHTTATFQADKDEEAKLIDRMTVNLETVNQSMHQFMIKTIDKSTETFTKGNQLGHKTTKKLLHKTANGFSKIADIINQKL